jgi:hypothetical protein
MNEKTCVCGRKVKLESSWANACECGQEYNGWGQALAPRSQWGWETGEIGLFNDSDMRMICPACGGSGYSKRENLTPCDMCDGTGIRPRGLHE